MQAATASTGVGCSPRFRMSEVFSRGAREFSLHSPLCVFLWNSMDDELTNLDPRASEDRMTCSDAPSGSNDTPQQPGALDHQGAASERALGRTAGSAELGSFSPTTVVAVRTGGASRSKWTRKTRPWNAKPETTVVAFETPDPESMRSSSGLRNHSIDARFHARRSPRRSPTSQGWRRPQGTLREILAANMSACMGTFPRMRATASTAPSSEVRFWAEEFVRKPGMRAVGMRTKTRGGHANKGARLKRSR